MEEKLFKILREEQDEYTRNIELVYMIREPENKELILKNMDNILNSLSGLDALDVIGALKEEVPEEQEKYTEKMNQEKENIAIHMIERAVMSRYTSMKEGKRKISPKYFKNMEVYKNTLGMVLKEVVENENKNYDDIETLDSGYYSTAYKIGEKVLKIGEPREKYSVPQHRRILEPLLRTNLYEEDEKEIFATIEVSELVETKDDFKLYELYEVYKDLREDGIIWADAAKKNIGRLKKPNEIHWKEKLEVDRSSVGFYESLKNQVKNEKSENKKELLQAGELVVLDTDYIYLEEEIDIDMLAKTKKTEFKIVETMYQEEKKGVDFSAIRNVLKRYVNEELEKQKEEKLIEFENKTKDDIDGIEI